MHVSYYDYVTKFGGEIIAHSLLHHNTESIDTTSTKVTDFPVTAMTQRRRDKEREREREPLL